MSWKMNRMNDSLSHLREELRRHRQMGVSDSCLSETTLQALADGSLNALETSAARKHMAGCVECLSAYAEFRALWEMATASEMGPAMLLEWTTAAEKGLQAWNIYRSETPGGPFTRLNSVAVPAMGDSPGDTGYIFVDDYVGPGRRYYYLLEGLTSLGLPQRSHVVSGRIVPGR